MDAFVIRNYGSSRNLPDGHGSYIFMERDSVRETNDEAMAKLFATYPDVLVSRRNEDLVNAFPAPPEGPPPPVEEDDENEQGENEQGEDPAAVVDESTETDYGSMLLVDLQEIAKDRNIAISGVKKADLVVLLEEYDEKISSLILGQEVRIDDEDKTYVITVLPEEPNGEFTLELKEPDGNEYGATADQLTIINAEP